MQYLTHPQLSVSISRVGFGCLALGGYGVGQVDFHDLQRAVLVAIERGITLFDTADVYGLGESEERLGRWLKELGPAVRARLVVATKVGVRKSTTDGAIFFDNSISWMEEALEASLRRLKTDRIDLYQIHNYDQKTPLADIFQFLTRQQERGKIRAFGFSNTLYETLAPYLAHYPLASTQMELSLLQKKNEHCIRQFQDHGSLCLLHGSLAQGLLSGKYRTARDLQSTLDPSDVRRRPQYVQYHGERLAQNLKIIEQITDRFPSLNLGTLALGWALQQFPRAIPLLGVKRSSDLAIIDDLFTVADSLSTDDLHFLNHVLEQVETQC